MPVEFTQRWASHDFDTNHSKRRDRSRGGIKIPNDYRRGRKQKRR